MKLQEALIKSIKILNDNKIEEAGLISRLFLAYILGIKKEELVVNSNMEMEKTKEDEYFEGVYRISSGHPVQYLIGKKEFMKMDFFVNENVLIPRSDTEVLVEKVIELAGNKKEVLELCTGSGVISISLAKYTNGLYIVATDISKDAIKIAKKNCKNLLCDANIKFVQSDMFENVNGKFDIIVSNPPYIKTDVIATYNLKYEPKIALDGGQDGLKFYKEIINNGYKYLNENRSNCS